MDGSAICVKAAERLISDNTLFFGPLSTNTLWRRRQWCKETLSIAARLALVYWRDWDPGILWCQWKHSTAQHTRRSIGTANGELSFIALICLFHPSLRLYSSRLPCNGVALHSLSWQGDWHSSMHIGMPPKSGNYVSLLNFVWHTEFAVV